MADEQEERLAHESEPRPMQTKDVLVRIVEWSCWLPEQQDPNMPEGAVSTRGITAFQALEHERVVEIKVLPTPVKADAEGDSGEMVQHALYGFQAVLAMNAPASQELRDIVSPQPTAEDSVKMVEGFQRDQRARAMAVGAEAMPQTPGPSVRADHKTKGGKRR